MGTLAYEFPSSTLFILGHFRKVVRGASACGIPFAKQMYNYQIAIFENGNVTQAGALRTALDGRLSDLGVDSAAVKYFDEETVASRDPRAAFVAVYFAGIGSHKLTNTLNELVRDSLLVLPLVPSLKDYASLVPHELRGINGLLWDGSDQAREASVSVLLEGLSLLRKTRRVFISYLRKETSGFNEIDCQVCLDHKLFIFCELSRQEQRRGLDRTRRSLSSPDGTF